MKINEFIENMSQNKSKLLKSEQVQSFIKKELSVKEYLSIKDKKQLVEDIVNECILYEDGVFKFDDIDKYICFTMRTIAAYTDLELSDDMEDDYDTLCEAKLLNAVIETFTGEYENVKVLLQMRCDYVLSNNNIESQVGRALDSLLDKVDVIANALSNKINNFYLGQIPIEQNDLQKLLSLIDKK